MKRLIRLTENDLHRIIKTTVQRVINETSLHDFNEYGDNDITELINRYKEIRSNPKYRFNQELKREATELFKQIKEYIINERQDLVKEYNLFLDDIYNSGNYIVCEPDGNSMNKTAWYAEKDNKDNLKPIPSMVAYALQYLR